MLSIRMENENGNEVIDNKMIHLVYMLLAEISIRYRDGRGQGGPVSWKKKKVSPNSHPPSYFPISASKLDSFCGLIMQSLRKVRNAVVLRMIHGLWFNSMATSITVPEMIGETVWGVPECHPIWKNARSIRTA